jgi:hypothetical protein
MRARLVSARARSALISLWIAGLLAGCGGPPAGDGSSTSTDSKAGARRRDMENFMKNQPPGGTRKP